MYLFIGIDCYSLAMSGFDSLSEEIKTKLTGKGYVNVDKLPDYDDDWDWNRLETKCNLLTADITAIRKVVKQHIIKSQCK